MPNRVSSQREDLREEENFGEAESARIRPPESGLRARSERPIRKAFLACEVSPPVNGSGSVLRLHHLARLAAENLSTDRLGRHEPGSLPEGLLKR
jgi:hypothetical protein